MAVSPDDSIIGRPGHRDRFRGARYELGVAAIMVRAGPIGWITDAG
jgi:hypothetical protein